MIFHTQEHDEEIRAFYWKVIIFEVLKLCPILLWRPLTFGIYV